MNIKPILYLPVILLSLNLSCGAEDSVRDTDLLRDIFYPDVYARQGIGDNTPGNRFDQSEYRAVLKRFVTDKGVVNYEALAGNLSELDNYLDHLSVADLDKLSKYSRIAVLLNSYNAFTLKLITGYPGIKTIKDIPENKRWKDKRWILGGEKVSLDELEHEMIRKKYGDARVHFALVCAAKSCPRLRNEPYSGDKLISQLDDQAREFFKENDNFRWDNENNTVYLSEILDWFRNDFADDEKGVLDYLEKYLDNNIAAEIAGSKNVKIKYIPYNWSLNGTWK